MTIPEGFESTPKLASIHSFSATAISKPTPSMLSLASASISFCSTCKRFLAQIVCSTPFFPAARAVAPNSGLKIAGRGFVRQMMFPFCSLTVVGTATPAPSKKYSLFTGTSVAFVSLVVASACSRAGSTVLLPSQLISQSPSMLRVVSSSSHSTISTLVPSLLRPGSNSKRARALLELREGDSTSSGAAGARTAPAEEVSTALKGGLVDVAALMVVGVAMRCG